MRSFSVSVTKEWFMLDGWPQLASGLKSACSVSSGVLPCRLVVAPTAIRIVLFGPFGAAQSWRFQWRQEPARCLRRLRSDQARRANADGRGRQRVSVSIPYRPGPLVPAVSAAFRTEVVAEAK